MYPHRLPMPPQIMEDPERAILAALEVTLEIAVNSLLAAYPELCDDDFPLRVSEAARWADRLISEAKKMEGVLAGYRYSLSTHKGEENEREKDPPF
jgi:hypothetical protein